MIFVTILGRHLQPKPEITIYITRGNILVSLVSSKLSLQAVLCVPCAVVMPGCKGTFPPRYRSSLNRRGRGSHPKATTGKTQNGKSAFTVWRQCSPFLRGKSYKYEMTRSLCSVSCSYCVLPWSHHGLWVVPLGNEGPSIFFPLNVSPKLRAFWTQVCESKHIFTASTSCGPYNAWFCEHFSITDTIVCMKLNHSITINTAKKLMYILIYLYSTMQV